jgi:hypothetical protein
MALAKEPMLGPLRNVRPFFHFVDDSLVVPKKGEVSLYPHIISNELQ